MTDEKSKLGPPGQVRVYTDGGCKPNPGPGGWGAVIRFGDHEWTLSGNDPQTTNNRMEMQAAVAALGLLESRFGRCTVELYTDSEYVRQGVTNWVEGWERNGWQTKGKEPVKNRALWQALHQLGQRHDTTWHWLKGHAGHRDNERADQLATRARAALRSSAPRPPRTTKAQSADVEIFVKASFFHRLQAGGWGVVLCKGENTRTLGQREEGMSANALLIRAATEALKALTRPCSVLVYSDADYLIRGASQWIKGWLTRDWLTRDGKPVANRAEWESLQEAMRPHQVTWRLGQVDEMTHLAQAGEVAAAAAAGGAEDG